MADAPERGSSLHWRILLGLILGAVVGGTVNYFTAVPYPTSGEAILIGGGAYGAFSMPRWLHLTLKYGADPVGEIFLRLLLLTVVPLVFASLAIGVTRLGDLSKLGRMGARTFAYFLVTMTIGVGIGLVLVNTIRPGEGLDPATVQQLQQRFGGEAETRLQRPGFDIDTIVDIVPRNPFRAAVELQMLSIIFLALLTGIALTRFSPERTRAFRDVLETVGDITIFIIGLAMRIAPVGVFALIFSTTARFGFGLLGQLGQYVLVVLVGLLIQMCVTYPILLRTLARVNPLVFFSRIRLVIVTAFSTSSSNATLPTSIKVAEEELKIPPPVAGFVLPLGATMNMNGTALFEGVTAVFLAQVFGVQLGLLDQMVVVVLCVLTAVGAAGVPGGSIPLLAMVLTSVGVPATAVFLILGVDRILDMCRTTLNVVGDLTAAAYVARVEKIPAEEPLPQVDGLPKSDKGSG